MWQPWQQTNDKRLQNSVGQNLRNLAECIGNVTDMLLGTYLVQISAGTRTILSVNLRGFHHSVRASVGIVPRLFYD